MQELGRGRIILSARQAKIELRTQRIWWLHACSTNLGSESKKRLADIGKRIDRIVSAIADGTDTPNLRRALLSLDNEKVEF